MDAIGSENASGAVNQQERLDPNVRPESSETIRQAPSEVRGEDMVRSAWRHAEPGRNALAPGSYAGGNNNVGPYPMQP